MSNTSSISTNRTRGLLSTIQLSILVCSLLPLHLDHVSGYQREVEDDVEVLASTPSRVHPVFGTAVTQDQSYATLITSKRVALPRTTRALDAASASTTTATTLTSATSSTPSHTRSATSKASTSAPSFQTTLSDTIVHDKQFVSPRVTIGLLCEENETIMRANFTTPFRGVLGAGNHDSTMCRIQGGGALMYELRVAHNSTDCGTQLDQERGSIFNTLFIRFHNKLELDGDIVKNLQCKMSLGDVVVGRQRDRRTGKLRQSRPK